MARWMIGTMVVMIALGGVGSAQEQKKKRKPPGGLVGTWVKEAGDMRVQFTFKGRKLHGVVSKGNEKVTIDADIGLAKGGNLFGRIAKVTPRIDDGPQVGLLFGWRYQIDGEKMTISEATASQAADEARKFLNGEYVKTK